MQFSRNRKTHVLREHPSEVVASHKDDKLTKGQVKTGDLLLLDTGLVVVLTGSWKV